MHVRCPHCHNSIEIVGDASFTEINCPSCGSSFSLIGGDTTETFRSGTRRFAHFEFVRELGIGKFGSVWMARDTQLDRTVAIKIPRKGALDAEETELFLRDARATAQLKHPNIVGVHEVGREHDTVYIVTDYIEGANLKEWLSGQRLSFRESAELIVKVAEALDHAHKAGVVHRDLKPGNIMLDVDAQPHVIDFGLAKRATGEITMTVDGHILGTPAYMSPEQAKGKGHEADRRSDIYSLGVILFELLTGELPFRGEAQMLLLQIQRDEPPRPRRLDARIPRDLETITLRCLQKEPSRRYQTGEELAGDLTRWLGNEPIVARPVGRLERGWRWCQRNPAVATLTAAVFLVLASGAAVSTYFAVEARLRATDALGQQARADAKAVEAQTNARRATEASSKAAEEADRAITEARKAARVAEFLAGMFEVSAPHVESSIRFSGLRVRGPVGAQDPSMMTAAQLLERGARKVVEELEDQPAVQAALMDTIGNVYIGLGRIDDAEPLLISALETRRGLHPEPHLETASSLWSLAVLRGSQLRIDEAIVALREVLTVRTALLGHNHKDTVDAKFILAFALISAKKNTQETESLLVDALDWRRVHLGEENPETAFAMAALAATLAARGEVNKAAPLFTRAVAALVKNPETRSAGLAMAEEQQARLMWQLGQWKAAVDVSRRAVKHFLEFSADDHFLFAQVASTHVQSLLRAGQTAEAKQFCRDWVKRLRDRGSPGVTWGLRELLAILFVSRDPADLDEAELLYHQWLEMTQVPGRHPNAGDAAFSRFIESLFSDVVVPGFMACELRGEVMAGGKLVEKRPIEIQGDAHVPCVQYLAETHVGESVEATILVPLDDEFHVTLLLGGGPDFGIVDVKLDGSHLCRVDCYDKSRKAWIGRRAGARRLQHGTYKLVLTAIGNNAASSAAHVGLVGLQLRSCSPLVKTWSTIGTWPCPQDGGWDTVWPPEQEPSLTATYDSPDQGRLAWKAVDQEIVHFEGDRRVAYGQTYVFSPDERLVGCYLGKDDQLKVWVNDDAIFDQGSVTPIVPDSYFCIGRLKSGWNRILVKNANWQGGFGYCMRLGDPNRVLRVARQPE